MIKGNVNIQGNVLNNLTMYGYYTDEDCKDYTLEIDKEKLIDLLKQIYDAKEIILR